MSNSGVPFPISPNPHPESSSRCGCRLVVVSQNRPRQLNLFLGLGPARTPCPNNTHYAYNASCTSVYSKRPFCHCSQTVYVSVLLLPAFLHQHRRRVHLLSANLPCKRYPLGPTWNNWTLLIQPCHLPTLHTLHTFTTLRLPLHSKPSLGLRQPLPH